jgi:hypothetical protein
MTPEQRIRYLYAGTPARGVDDETIERMMQEDIERVKKEMAEREKKEAKKKAG